MTTDPNNGAIPPVPEPMNISRAGLYLAVASCASFLLLLLVQPG